MTYKQNRPSFLGNPAHLTHTFLLERSVADCEHFIYKENFGFQMSCNGKSEPYVHSARVMLYRRLDKFFNFREGDNNVKFVVDLVFFHAQYRAIEVDVFPPSQFGVKSRSDFQQG